MKIIVAFLILFIHPFTLAKQPSSKMPKILWTFWDNGFEGAPPFTQLCINNMDHYSKKSGWEFRLLTKANYTDYISKKGQEKIKRMIETSKTPIVNIRHQSDIIRLFLIYENGGMWLDTNSFFLNPLSWIQNIENETSPYNRVNGDPEFISFTYNDNYGGNKTRVIDQKSGEQIYLFPGIEIWSFIAKPYSKFLQDVLSNLEYSLSKPTAVIYEQNNQKGFLYNTEYETYFFTSNYQFQTILQKKQKEIEQNPSKYNNQYLYAVDYYKIWSIDSLTSAFSLLQIRNWQTPQVIETLFYDSIESFTSISKTELYFFKFTNGFYSTINTLLQEFELLNCLKLVQKIPKDSIVYQYLLEPSLQLQFVQKLIKPNSQVQQCKILSDRQYSIVIFSIISIILLLIAINIIIFWLVQEREQKTYIHLNQSNDL